MLIKLSNERDKVIKRRLLKKLQNYDPGPRVGEIFVDYLVVDRGGTWRWVRSHIGC